MQGFGQIEEIVQDATQYQKHPGIQRITKIHRPPEKAGFHFELYTTVRTVAMMLQEFGRMVNRILKQIARPASWTFTGQYRPCQ